MDNMELKLKAIDLLWRNQSKPFTINEMNKVLKKTYSHVNSVVNNLIKEDVIKKEVVGHSFRCSLNKESDKAKALTYLSEVTRKEEYLKKYDKLKLLFSDLLNEFPKQVISVILFGSYAKESFNDKSDIDLLILVNEKVELGNLIRSIYALHGKELSIIVLTKHEFNERKEEAIINEIRKDHIILSGFEEFIEVIR